LISAKTKFSALTSLEKDSYVCASLTFMTSLSPPWPLLVACLESSFLNGEKTTFSLLVAQEGQGGQRGPREVNEETHGPFFQGCHYFFADVQLSRRYYVLETF
jgi:hypothetical protein